MLVSSQRRRARASRPTGPWHLRRPQRAAGPRKGSPLASPFTEALSTLNDRALRRLLGARAYLRGYDYVRRHAVDNIQVDEASAKGQVRGSDPEPYEVT